MIDDETKEPELTQPFKHQRPDNLNLFSTKEPNASKVKLRKSQSTDQKMSLLPKLSLNLYSRPAEKTALEICGEQMEKVNCLTCDQRENFIRNEQGIKLAWQ